MFMEDSFSESAVYPLRMALAVGALMLLSIVAAAL